MVLFYASWCPFSQAFLTTYLEARRGRRAVLRAHHRRRRRRPREKYAIDVFPTVLFFEKGRLVKRLDGVYHRGLSQGQLEDFARRCAVK